MRAIRKTEHIHASASDLLHIRIGNLDLIGANVGIAKMKQEKYIVGAMLTASVKIPDREGNIVSSSSLYGQLAARLLVRHVSLFYLVDEFIFLFLI